MPLRVLLEVLSAIISLESLTIQLDETLEYLVTFTCIVLIRL
jgi:hypothetical protein